MRIALLLHRDESLLCSTQATQPPATLRRVIILGIIFMTSIVRVQLGFSFFSYRNERAAIQRSLDTRIGVVIASLSYTLNSTSQALYCTLCPPRFSIFCCLLLTPDDAPESSPCSPAIPPNPFRMLEYAPYAEYAPYSGMTI